MTADLREMLERGAERAREYMAAGEDARAAGYLLATVQMALGYVLWYETHPELQKPHKPVGVIGPK